MYRRRISTSRRRGTNSSGEMQKRRMSARSVDMRATWGTWLILLIHFMVSSVLHRKWGCELGLEHPDLGLIQLPLVLHQLLLVALQGHHHSVEPLGQLPQLVILIGWDVDVQVVVDHLADGAVEPLDGIEHLPAQPQAHKHGEAHAHQGAAHRHRGEQAPGIPVQCLGPLEDGVQPHLLLKGRPIGVLLPLLAQLLPASSCPQLDSQAAGQGGLAGVDGPPVPVEEQQVALSAVGPSSSRWKSARVRGDDQIARVLPASPAIRAAPRNRGALFPSPPSTCVKASPTLCRAA